MIKETKQLMDLRHENVLQFYGHCWQVDGGVERLLLVTEFMERGSL